MINIARQKVSPASLKSTDIQDYITSLHQHLHQPAIVPKPPIAPAYRKSDLLEAFDECFYSKCYLTEQWFPNSWAMDIEHFVPQNENPTQRFEWTNLYPAEHKANNMKPRSTPAGGYLNPCDPDDDVENEILYSVGVMGQSPNFSPKSLHNTKAVNTSALLNRIHNGHDNATQNSTAALRHEIFTKYHLILELIIDWMAAPVGSQLKFNYETQLKSHLSRKKSFTMLMRSMTPVLIHIPSSFFD